MAKTDQQLAQEELARQGIDYKYGGDTLMGAFMPERRQVISPERNQIVGYDDRGRAMVETVPATYGPSEFDFEYTPVVRGAKAAGSFLRDVFFGDANEQSQALGQAGSAIRGILGAVPEMVNEQVAALEAGGAVYNPETGQLTEFDPTLVMGGAGAGQAVARRGNQALEMSDAARMQRAREMGFNTDRPLYHYTPSDVREFNVPQGDRQYKFGRGVYASADPTYGDRYVREGSGYAEGANAMPLYARGNLAGGEAYEAAWRQANENLGIRQQALDMRSRGETVDQAGRLRIRNMVQDEAQRILKEQGYDGVDYLDEVMVFDPQNVRSTSARFDPAMSDSAQVLYSGGGRQGSIIAGGSAIREAFRIGDEGFDPRFDNRAKEQQRILDTELRYEGSPIIRPDVSIYDLEGKPFALTMADRTKAGSKLIGVEDVDYDIPVDLQGGQDFMFANPLGREGQVWAQDKGATSMYLNSFMGLGGQPLADEIIMLPYRMAPTGGDFATMTAETMLTHARNNMTKKSKAKVDKSLKSIYPEWKGIDNPESMNQIAMMKGDPRKKILQVMDRDFRNEGGIGIGQARLAVTDRMQYNAPDYTLQNVGAADPYMGRFEQSGHRTYSQGLAGRPIGTLIETDINAMELLPDFVRGRGFGSVDELLAADPETLAKEYYTMRRGLRGGVITEDMLRDIERRREQ